jgi:hypothetical protein
MNKETNVVFQHYRLNGEVEPLDAREAQKRMEVLAKTWESQKTRNGELYSLGDENFVFMGLGNGLEVYSLGHQLPEKNLINLKATKVFGQTIYGDCFLKLETTAPLP